jgi:two-component system sensor kinase FixL
MKIEMHTDWTIWLHQQRRIATNVLMGFIAVLGLMGWIVSLIRVIQERTLTLNFAYYTISYAAVMILYLVRKIPDTWRSFGFLVLLYAFGSLSLYTGWLAGGGRIFLLTMIVVNAILINPRNSFYTAGLILSTYVLFGLAFNRGWLELRMLPDPTAASPILIEGIGFAMNIVMVTGSLWFFGKALMAADRANREAQEARSLLNAQAKELEAANQLIARQSEQALKYSEEKFRNVVQQAIDAIVLTDEQGLITDWNTAAEQITGIGKSDAVGQYYWDVQLKIMPEERRSQTSLETLRAITSSVFQTGQAPWLNRVLDAQIQHSDGARRFIQQVAFPIQTAKGFMIGSIIRDVTDRKQIEIERESLIQKLETQNAELERFAYTVSHDLKSPLITIGGFLGYLEEDALKGNNEKLKRDIQHINNATGRMKRLLDELLELSRIGRLMNKPETIPFADLVREAMDNVHGQLEAGRVTVQTQPDLPAVHGDRQRLVEVLQNLLDNAAKFMGDQPDPRIEIGQRGEDAQHGKPVFYVKDNGIGIAPEYHERVFGLFNQLDPKMEGTGVGLALVKRIVEFHGGRIWIESEAGKGSTFYFTLSRQHNSS